MSKNYQFDIVQKPKHYTDTGIEHSDVVEAWNMDYFIGNCTKYLCRWEKKANEEYQAKITRPADQVESEVSDN
jgi:hypothetical protein